MSNSTLFTQAHEAARKTVHIVGDYRIAFSLALKTLIKTAKFAKQLTEYAANVYYIGTLNAGQNVYCALTRILEETVKLNKPKKATFNWSTFDEDE